MHKEMSKQVRYSPAERDEMFEVVKNKKAAGSTEYVLKSAMLKCWWLARCTCPSEGVQWPTTDMPEEGDEAKNAGDGQGAKDGGTG